MLYRALVFTALAVAASGQAVISTHSGVVHYFEGAVFLNDQLLESHLGKFATVGDGGQLRTAQGRAEVLLTPGVVLRMDQNSSIRMVSSSLADTKVELLTGSAIVDDAAEPDSGTAVTLIHRSWQIRFPKAGAYRIDCSPARVWTLDGRAEVSARVGDLASGETGPVLVDGRPVLVETGMDVPLTTTLAAERSIEQPRDLLDNWSRGRAESIAADNAIAANIQDPASLPDADLAALADVDLSGAGSSGFTQFPMLGLGPATPGFSSIYTSQPGFYSSYLPGYTYRPLFLVLSPVGPRSTLYAPYSNYSRSVVTTRTPVSAGTPGLLAPRPVTGVAPMRPPIQTVRPYQTVSPVARPVAPISRPTPAPVVHPVQAPRAAGHR